tara:strand:+ start:1155 stop:2093 length:939 start_codon:yes stop_codon:yes gene_type:complete
MTEIDALNVFLSELGFGKNLVKDTDFKSGKPFSITGLTSGATITDLKNISNMSKLSSLESLTLNGLDSLSGSNVLTNPSVLPSSLTTLDLQHNGLCVTEDITKLFVGKLTEVIAGDTKALANMKGDNDSHDNCYCGDSKPHHNNLNIPGLSCKPNSCSPTCDTPAPPPSGCSIKVSVVSGGTGGTGGKLQIKITGDCDTPSTESVEEHVEEPVEEHVEEPVVGYTNEDTVGYTKPCSSCNEPVSAPEENALLRNNIEETIEPVDEISYDNKDSDNEICEHCLVTIGDEKHCNKFLDKEDCDYLGDSYSWKGN